MIRSAVRFCIEKRLILSSILFLNEYLSTEVLCHGFEITVKKVECRWSVEGGASNSMSFLHVVPPPSRKIICLVEFDWSFEN